jgi:predicted NUDIX family NTP pyrophosphohydrolase
VAIALSAGLLLYRRVPIRGIEVLLVHMGGPFWTNRDEGGWSIPKGEYEQGDDPVAVVRREFSEELGKPAPDGQLVSLGEVRQPSGKRITAWAIEADLDVTSIESNTFELEWPPGSGRRREFPEVDRADWFDVARARTKLVSGQVPFLDLLLEHLSGGA